MDDVAVSVVPEPATLGIVLALAPLTLQRRRRGSRTSGSF
jgi:hypothetical protein